MNGCRSLLRGRVPRYLGLVILAWAATALPASANPLPTCAVVVHVQAWDPDLCDHNTIGSCEDATQYSEIEGDVEFDLYLDNPFEALPPFEVLTTTVQWPAAWQFTSFESCSGGNVTLSVAAQQVGVEIQYELPLMPGGWTYLGRLRMQVSGFGALEFAPLGLDGGLYGEFGPAQAGVECSYSYLECSSLMPPCSAYLQVDAIELHVPQEGTGVATVLVWRGWDGMSPCSVEFLEAAEWMAVDVVWDEYGYEGVLSVRVDAAGLAPGTYEAMLRVTSEIVECVPVTLYVEPVASAPDAGTPAVQQTSWGELKRAFR